jgi:hypothetical protein
MRIEFVFKHKGKKELRAFLKSLETADETRDDFVILSEVVTDWTNVKEKFTPENFEAFLDAYPTAARALFDAYLPALLEGKEKNSGPQ